jgi:phosphoserine phosphatase
MDCDMTRVILVRHGQTEWNRVERFRGRADVPLNETGLRQAQAAARRIAGTWTMQAVYYSNLARARVTAQTIATACSAPASADPGLLDIDYGEWTGLSPDEVAGRGGDLLKRWYEQPQSLQIPGGESLDEVRRRAVACMDRLAAQHAGNGPPELGGQGGRGTQTIALVSHLVVCRLLVLAALGLDSSSFWRIQQETATMNVFEWENGVYKIVAINDACHLVGV